MAFHLCAGEATSPGHGAGPGGAWNTAQASLAGNAFPKPRLLVNHSQFSQISYFLHKMCLYLENTD